MTKINAIHFRVAFLLEVNSARLPHLADLRGLIAKTVLEVMRTYSHAYFGTHLFGGCIEESLIVLAVLIGQADGRLMCASDIADYIGLPRPTVIRKLQVIGRARALRSVKVGRRVCYWMDDVNDPSIIEAVGKATRTMERFGREVSKLSKMNTANLDPKTAKP